MNYLSLPGGVPNKVAGHEPPIFSVMGGKLDLLENETRPFGDFVTLLLSWPPFSALALDYALR